MNANLKLSRQFALATLCGLTLTLIVNYIAWKFVEPDRPLHFQLPTVIVGGFTGLLALVTVGVFVGGLAELAFRPRKKKEEVAKTTNNENVA